MPHRLQIVHTHDGVELLLAVDGGVRSLKAGLKGAPWTADALEHQEVKVALVRWMLATGAEGWIDASELSDVLKAQGVDPQSLAARHPAKT